MAERSIPQSSVQALPIAEARLLKPYPFGWRADRYGRAEPTNTPNMRALQLTPRTGGASSDRELAVSLSNGDARRSGGAPTPV